MRLEPATPRSRVKHSTTDPLRSLQYTCTRACTFTVLDHTAIYVYIKCISFIVHHGNSWPIFHLLAVITGIEIAKICESIDEETNDGRATTTDTERIETVAITEKLIIETGHAKPEQTETDVEKIEKGNAKDS